MNTKQLTMIDENGGEKTWRAPLGGRISETQVKGKDCFVVTSVVGTELKTYCFATGRSTSSGTPGSGTPTSSCGCNGT
jgi:hypothetical protein